MENWPNFKIGADPRTNRMQMIIYIKVTQLLWAEDEIFLKFPPIFLNIA